MTAPGSHLSIRKATPHDIAVIQDIAFKTWPVAYGAILSAGQLDYMLDLIYSSTALQQQMNEAHKFYIASENETPIGFCDFGLIKDGTYKLHKLYVLPLQQKTGAGKALLEFTMATVKDLGADELILNVNRHNKAKGFYEKMGFTVSREEDIDIGNGYFMNDYVMTIPL